MESSAKNAKRLPSTPGISLLSQGTTRLRTIMVIVARPRFLRIRENLMETR
jgi:hypothetical protein